MGSVNDLIRSGPFLGTEQGGGLGPARPSVEPGPRSAMLPEPNLFDSPDGLIHRIEPDPPTVGCLVRKAAEIWETGDGDHVLILP